MARVSKRGKIRAAKSYLRFRGLYGKNYLTARYNQLLDRTLGHGNYNADILFKNKIKQAKKQVKNEKKNIKSVAKNVKRLGGKLTDGTGEVLTYQEVIDTVANKAAVDLALSSKKVRKRVKKMKNLKKKQVN